MPNYTFLNTKTGKSETHFMTMAEAEAFDEANPHLNWLCGAQPIADPIRIGRQKPSEGFRDILRNIKKSVGKDRTGQSIANVNTF